jgi:hypothetical protein
MRDLSIVTKIVKLFRIIDCDVRRVDSVVEWQRARGLVRRWRLWGSRAGARLDSGAAGVLVEAAARTSFAAK